MKFRIQKGAVKQPAPERGGVIVFFSLALLALIGVVAFAIDLGRMMREQTFLKTAADAAVLKAAKARLEGKSQTEADQIARDMINANLIAAGYSAAERAAIVTPSVLSVNFPVATINGESQQRVNVAIEGAGLAYVFARAIPGWSKSGSLTVDSTAALQPAKPKSFMVVLDISGSMGYNDGGTPPTRKILGLKQALRKMIEAAPNHEYQFAPYSTDATCVGKERPPFSPAALGTLPTDSQCIDERNKPPVAQDPKVLQFCDILDYIDGLGAAGGTDMGCGVSRLATPKCSGPCSGSETTLKANYDFLDPARDKEIILLTDGQPNMQGFDAQTENYLARKLGLSGFPCGCSAPGPNPASSTSAPYSTAAWNGYKPGTDQKPRAAANVVCIADSLRQIYNTRLHTVGFGDLNASGQATMDPKFLQRVANTEEVMNAPEFNTEYNYSGAGACETGNRDADGKSGKSFMAEDADQLADSLLQIAEGKYSLVAGPKER